MRLDYWKLPEQHRRRGYSALLAIGLGVVGVLLVYSGARSAPTKYPTPADVAPLGDGVEAALALYNLHRSAAGSSTAVLDEGASVGARAHVAYMLSNERAPRGHFEDPSLPGFTSEGDAAARSSSIGSGFPSAVACVQGLLAIPYHRFRFLQPGVERVRLAFDRNGTRTACVFGIVSFNNAAARTGSGPLVYPADGATDVPLILGNESPDPVALCRDGVGAAYTRPAGFPITVELVAASRGLRIDTSSLTSGDGASVEHCVINAEIPHPDHAAILASGTTSSGWTGSMIVVPREPLRPGTRYEVRMTGSGAGVPFDVRSVFSTLDLRPFTGPVPVGPGPGLLVAGADPRVPPAAALGVTVPTLLDELSRQGCRVGSLWQVKNGRMTGFIVGAPEAVNRAFPDATVADRGQSLPLIRSGRPFIAICG